MTNVGTLIVLVALVALAAVSGSQFTPGPWYASLAKPAWTPPGWLFPIAWTALYAMIAVAGWRVWKKPVRAPRSSFGCSGSPSTRRGRG